MEGRGIAFDEDWPTAQKQRVLKDSQIQEWTFRQLTKDVSYGSTINGQSNCAYYVLDSVPCILHAENRMGLKILELLLDEGLNTCHRFPRLMEKWHNSPKKCREAYVLEITEYINTVSLGTVERPAQWECPIDKDYLKVDTICLDNGRTRRVVDSWGGLIDICGKSECRKEKWNRLLCKTIAVP